jgi:hypothetical protein
MSHEPDLCSLIFSFIYFCIHLEEVKHIL